MTESTSKYALKRAGRVNPIGRTRPRRTCTKCGRTLTGRKGHGFPGMNGHGVYCGGCAIGVRSEG